MVATPVGLVPLVPDVPEDPEDPSVPEEPDVPEDPEDPSVPEEPDVPDVPEDPEDPEAPVAPVAPLFTVTVGVNCVACAQVLPSSLLINSEGVVDQAPTVTVLEPVVVKLYDINPPY